MIFNTSIGDKYGSNRISSPSIKNHLRPITGHFGFGAVVQPSLLVNVRTDMGKAGNNGFFQHFQLSCH